ncbi:MULTISPECIES: DUF6114 domain-containing protein [Actinoplanes]|uniref:DUF6114 domain-containing protein n=1 Tax=Actinoplanes TaxID=1865 RepID=UPI0007C7EC24|nr:MULTISPECIES: DUF6114 domain-containing protein [Actinoplanes]GLY02528.1 hypothetical protein Acsp01_29070 [Actinoplanes sp. NBRC 101535]
MTGFKHWRRARPFWGGLLVLLGGAEIILTVWAPLPVVMHVGMQNFLGYLMPILILLSGLLLMFHPVQRVFYSLLAIILAFSSWITSNMGGFFIGMILVLVGGSLAFAWAPVEEEVAVPSAPSPDPDDHHEEKPFPMGFTEEAR